MWFENGYFIRETKRGRDRRRDVVVGQEMEARKVWKAFAIQKDIFTVDEEWFWTYNSEKMRAVSEWYELKLKENQDMKEMGRRTVCFGHKE